MAYCPMCQKDDQVYNVVYLHVFKDHPDFDKIQRQNPGGVMDTVLFYTEPAPRPRKPWFLAWRSEKVKAKYNNLYGMWKAKMDLWANSQICLHLHTENTDPNPSQIVFWFDKDNKVSGKRIWDFYKKMIS